MGERLKALRGAARRSGAPIPARLPADTTLFDVPNRWNLRSIQKRDLEAAGMKDSGKDGRGAVVDVHALRVSFCTHLAAAGVPLRTAQAAMRHSTPTLTANLYTDPHLLDVAGALDKLPDMQPKKAKQQKVAAGGETSF